MKKLLTWLLGKLLTDSGKIVLEIAVTTKMRPSQRDALLATLLTPEQREIVDALNKPERWQPDLEITPEEADQWGAMLRTPLMRKIDVAMVNMGQQKAQEAVHTPSEETIRAAGCAVGFRLAWMMAKSLSTLTGAKAGATEGDADTAAPALDHLNP